jgi:hypothetical protein
MSFGTSAAQWWNAGRMALKNRQALALVVVGLAAATLAGCATGGSSTPTATKTVTQTATPSDSSSPSDTTSSSPSSSSTDAAGGDTGGNVSSGTLCTVAQLTGGTAAGSGGAAGSNIIHLTFTNKSSTTCVLQGWPGVSFVGNGNGTQLGNPATLDRSAAHPTVTLKPGAVAVAPLKITQAANYDSAQCGPKAADGFRVYPPGSKASLYVKASGYTACTSKAVTILSVQAVVANGTATD